jgi:hypothetical protein
LGWIMSEGWWTRTAPVGTTSRTGCGKSLNCSTRAELDRPAGEVTQSEQANQSGVVSARRVFCPHPTLHARHRAWSRSGSCGYERPCRSTVRLQSTCCRTSLSLHPGRRRSALRAVRAERYCGTPSCVPRRDLPRSLSFLSTPRQSRESKCQSSWNKAASACMSWLFHAFSQLSRMPVICSRSALPPGCALIDVDVMDKRPANANASVPQGERICVSSALLSMVRKRGSHEVPASSSRNTRETVRWLYEEEAPPWPS